MAQGTFKYSRITIRGSRGIPIETTHNPIEGIEVIYYESVRQYLEEQQISTNAIFGTISIATRDERAVEKCYIVDRLETKREICFHVAYKKSKTIYMKQSRNSSFEF